MQTITIAYQIQGDKLIMPSLRWPDRCVCCGSPHPDSTLPLHHTARYASTTATISGYPLVWSVPYCGRCVRHSKFISPEAPVFITAFLVWFGLGYLLFLMDLAYNSIAIAFYVIAGVILAYGAYVLNRLLKTIQEKRNRRMMTPGCTHFRLATHVESSATNIKFDFYNDAIANEFATLNGYR